GLRPPDRNARTPPRLRRAGRDDVLGGRGARHRRGGRPLRPGLPPRPQADPEEMPASPAPAFDDVLGDALLSRHGARLRAPEPGGTRRDPPREGDAGPRQAGPLSRGVAREDLAPPRPPPE